MFKKIVSGIEQKERTACIRVGGFEYTFYSEHIHHDDKKTYIQYGELAADTKILINDAPVILADDPGARYHYNLHFNISFYPNGMIHQANLRNDTLIPVGKATYLFKSTPDGLRDKSNPLYSDYSFDLELHPTGNIKKGTLAKESTVLVGKNTIPFARDSYNYFYTNGCPERGYLAQNTNIFADKNMLELASGTRIEFYKGGNIKFGVLAERATVTVGMNRLTIAEGRGIEFFPNGAIKRATLCGDQDFHSGVTTFSLINKDDVEFFKDGTLQKIELREYIEYEINGQQILFLTQVYPTNLSVYSSLSFHPSLYIASGYIGYTRLHIGEYILPASGFIKFDEQGMSIRIDLAEAIEVHGEKYFANESINPKEAGIIPGHGSNNIHRYISRHPIKPTN